MFAVVSALSQVLAAIGTFGVISHFVLQRTREFGIRLAPGARYPGRVKIEPEELIHLEVLRLDQIETGFQLTSTPPNRVP